MNTFYLRVISSNKIFFDGRAEKIVLPLEDGEKAVLAHHENMVIATSIGEIRITTSKGEQVVGVVGEGFVQIVNNRVVLIVDSAEKPEDIDRVRAKEAKIRAEERQIGRETQTERESEGIQAERGITCPCTHKTQSNRKDIKPQRRNPKRLLAGIWGVQAVLTRSRSA